MDELRSPADQRRNRNFAETHRQLIERAVSLIGSDGVDVLSVSSLARDAGMNRSTVYYHFESREALLLAIKEWVGMRLSEAMLGIGDPAARLERSLEFTLNHPAVVHLWVMDLIEDGPIEEKLPFWGVLVDAFQRGQGLMEPVAQPRMPRAEAEVLALGLLSTVLMGTRVYKVAVRPQDSTPVIARRFAGVFDGLLAQARARR